ncbi:MAG: bacillithiol biosynthesis BshC, partial [Flavobacteriaceae bacterium]|nr:bacillithiol biosynthesis BshC [Flavobacteriaceae bacterium]
LLKAQKRMLADKIERLTDVQDTLFPSGNLQERNANFSEFYLEYGYDLLVSLKAELEPLDQEFTVLVIDRKGLPKN